MNTRFLEDQMAQIVSDAIAIRTILSDAERASENQPESEEMVYRLHAAIIVAEHLEKLAGDVSEQVLQEEFADEIEG